MAGISDQLTNYIPQGFGFYSLAGKITIALIIFIVVMLVGIGVFVFMHFLTYKKKIVRFEKINGRWQPVKKERARIIKIGDSGDEIWYCYKSKKFIPRATIQVGKNTFWFAVREDGEWINFELQDLDEQARDMNAHFLDKEMRYARVALQKSLEKRYNKIGFLEKYGALLMNLTVVAVICIFMYLLFDKWMDVSSSLSSAINAAQQVMEESRNILGTVDKVGCSGVTSAG